MKANFSLSIPKPCSENWNTFTPTSTGGFCGSCQKNVVDFTKATDEEIIAFINRKQEHACGRFRSDQLKTYTILPEVKIRPGFMLLRAGVISLLLLLISKPGSAQTSDLKTEIIKEQQVDSSSVQKTEFLIQGVVTSSEDGSAIPGVSIIQRTTANGTQTNGEGRFELRVDLSKGNILVFSFISLKTQEYKITADTQKVVIVMEPDLSTLGEVIVIAGGLSIERRELGNSVCTEPKSGLKKFWTKIKNLF